MNIAEDLSELEHRIFPKVTEKKLSEALNLLNKMKLIHKNEDGFWKATRESYATVAKCQDQMVLQYQMKCLELSKLAIESLGKESKDFTTMNFSISKKARKKVESAVETFKKRIREIVREDSEEATNVEHINLHVFSNTKD